MLLCFQFNAHIQEGRFEVIALLTSLQACLLIFLHIEGSLRGKMSSEATAKEVLYKPVDIEEDTPRKR